MAQKHKQRRGGGASSIHTLDIPALIETAARAQAGGRYREAVEAYKELLKREQRPEWTEGLAAAYAGRACDLAGKGMLKEAMALWRTRSELCGSPLMAGPYLEWLAQSGDTASLLLAYAERHAMAAAGGPDGELAALELSLAPVVLASPDAALAKLPAASPLLCHRTAALAALEAYCAGDDALDGYLGAIPFRSPYRDLRPILKALVLNEKDPQAAAALLVKLAADSPFQRLAAAARAATAPAYRLPEVISGLDSAARRLLFDLRGIPDRVHPVVEDLVTLGRDAPATALFDLLIRHHRLGAESEVEPLCRSLIPHAPERLQVYRKHFGTLSAVDETQLLAKSAEARGFSGEAEKQWLKAAQALEARNKEGDRLRAALVLRHIADLPANRSTDGAFNEQVVDWLQHSLLLDPDHLETTVQVLRSLRLGRDLKAARILVDEAIQRFTDNPDILLEAMEIALEGNAFKKAVSYARLVLKHDPINPRVRSSLGLAHMAHARKQIRSGKSDLARKELEQAGEWLRSGAERAALKLLKALMEQGEGHLVEARQQLQEGISELGGDLMGQFHVSLEAVRLHRDPVKTLKSLDLKSPKAAVAADVVVLVRTLDGLRVEAGTLRAALAPLSTVLRKAASQLFTEQEHLLICEVFKKA